MKSRVALTLISCSLVLGEATAAAYPLEDFKRTGIQRLEGYFYSLQTPSGQEIIVPGARLKPEQIQLRLDGRYFPLPAADPRFSEQLRQRLGREANNYGLAILDITDPDRPRYAALNATRSFMPASVGKAIVALALLQSLADIYPHDTASRERVLRDTQVRADEFVLSDTHEVPFWHRAEGTIDFRPLQPGDQANLWTFLDWMLSASSNAAASMVMKQILLLNHFRESYPPAPELEAAFFQETPPARLAALLQTRIRSAVERNGLSPDALMQGSFFTHEGKRRVPSVGSTATPQELLRLLLLLEQGRLVDNFSSNELKRLLYMTQRRTRYASSPLLSDAAVYVKSGSDFRCRPEAGFVCTNYRGNVVNLLNSMAIIEYPAGNPRYVYLVAATTNVLRQDSSELNADLAGQIQSLIEQIHEK